MKNKCIIVLGNVSEGFEFIGPFNDFDSASQYDHDHNEGYGWVATLLPAVIPVWVATLLPAVIPVWVATLLPAVIPVKKTKRGKK
jgi:hypothetical protein